MDFLVCGVYEVGEGSFSDVLLFIPECYILTQSLYIVFSTVHSHLSTFTSMISRPRLLQTRAYAPHPLLLKMSFQLFQPARFCFPTLYGVSARLSTYLKPSSSQWKGWVNLNAFHISMRLMMILAVGCNVLGIDWELESDWEIVELPEFICFWVLCRTEESVNFLLFSFFCLHVYNTHVTSLK